MLNRVKIKTMIPLVFSFALLSGATYADLRIPVERDGKVLKGVYLKVITSRNCTAFEKPGGKGGKQAIAPFKIFYQVSSDDGQKEEMIDGQKWIRVGISGTPKGVTGWIEEKILLKDDQGKEILIPQVIYWKTRALLYPRSDVISGKKPFTVYQSVNQNKVLAKQQLAGSQLTICPILNPPQTPDEPVYQMVFFAGEATKSTGTTIQNSDSIMQDIVQEIVYVIDTTKSMTNLLEGTKQIAEQSAQEISNRPELKGFIRFGLVEYQDSTPGLTASKVTIPLTDDINSFVSDLQKIHVTSQPSEETKEDVIAGLYTAITSEKVNWKSNSLKHIIILGDASAHLSGPKNSTGLSIKEVIDLAHPAGGGSEIERVLGTTTMHAVRAINPDDPEDHLECKKHFQQISRNNDAEKGFYDDVDPNDSADVKQAVDGLVKLISEAFNTQQNIASSNKAGTANALVRPEHVGEIAAKLWTLYELTTEQENQEVHEGFSDGMTQEGHIVADRRLLVRFQELDRTKASLKFIYKAFNKYRDDPSARSDVSGLLSGLQVLAASAGIGDYANTSNLQNIVTTLPLKSDVLQMTIDDIAVMDNNAFGQFLKKIEASQRRAGALLDDPNNWNVLIGDDANSSDKFSFLRLDELP